MRLLIKDITSEMNKIAELVSNEKNIPGVLLCIGENTMKIRYADGRKAYSGTIEVETEHGDINGELVVDYSRLTNILSKCQPSGIIVVDYITINFLDENLLEFTAQQKCLMDNGTEDGEYRVLAEKKMSLSWNEVNSSLRTAILGRMDYDSIFNAAVTDTWDIEELQDIFMRCGTEKSRVIYMSPTIQKAFVVNLAHTTSIPISSLEVSPLDIELVTTRMSDENATMEEVDNEIEKLYNRMKFPATISTTTAKQVCGILSKIGKGVKVFTHAENGYFSIFTEGADTGIWFAMSEGSKAQTSQFEKYSSIEYDSYQLNFVREFLVDAIKSAVSSSASEKLAFSFENNSDGELEIVLAVTNSNASVSDVYRVICDDAVDMVGDITEKQLKVSLKVFDDMLSQLKSEVIGMDIKVMVDGSACIRLAEINTEKSIELYYAARERLGLKDIEPTPVEEKVKYRANTLNVTQYTLVAK